MNRTRKSLAATVAMTVGLTFASAAAAADYVILESDVAGIDPGLVAAGDAIIDVPAGGTVMLIDPVGETRVVSGPFSGALSDAATVSESGSVLERLTASREQEKTTLGAVRAPKFEGGGLKE